MKKTLVSLFAMFLVTGVSASAFAMKHAMDEKIVAACKDKKAGDTVKVDGKDAKCPEAKAEAKKDAAKK